LLPLLVLSATALAADKAVATITVPVGCPTPVAIQSNGVAVGTIQILYVHVGMVFPAGPFACFNLNMAVQDDTGGKDPTYPATLSVQQIGGENVILSPGDVTLTASGIGAPVTGSPVAYTVSINALVPTIPELNEDGDTIVGNLRVQSSDNQLRTVTNILVKILLVHPSVTNCLKTYHEILNKDTFAFVPSMEVNVHKSGTHTGKVNNSEPPGIFDAVLAANTCAVDHAFDLLLAPSSYFEVQTSAPGNSIFVYSAAGEQSFPYFAFLTGTGMGTSYCLPNLVAPANSTLLATAALKIRDKTSTPVLWKYQLPNSGVCSPWAPGCVFDFSASLRSAGAACAGALLPSPPVSANPVTKSIDFTTP
jgi:hypothetical protein